MPGVTEAAMETEHRQKKKSKKVEAAEVSPDASDVKKKKKRKSDVLAEENGEASEQKKVKTEKTEIENPFSVANFRISDAVKQKLKEKGIDALFDIQAQTFDIVYDGNDLVGRARTGQGKTLAFVLPIIESLSRNNKDKGQLKSGRAPSVVVLAPTRELAKQVHADFEYYGRAAGLTTVCVYGGSQYGPQENALRRGVDVVVGTPGRVKDFLEKRVLNLKTLKFRVLDEADEMLNMGFVEDVELILGCVEDNSTVQTLLFSATMPHWVKEIANKFLKPNRKTVDLVGDDKMKASRSVRHLLLSCGYQVRPQVIADVIKVYGSGGRIIVFTETKNDASELAGILGTHVARALHGDIPQGQREVTLAGFRSGKFSVLVATDVAARGLDINDVQLIIQCEPPKDVETYIHRSGRTGRAGNTGIAVMLYDRKKEYMIPQIEGRAGFKFERITAPQPTDIARESGSTAAAAVSEVTDSVVPLFKVAAEELVKKSGLSTIDVLSKALAKISGYTSVSRRSLLTSHDDATTLLFRCQKSMYNPGYVFNILRGFLSEEVIGEVKRMTLTADSKGAVFDVPSKLVDEFIGGDDDFSIEIAEKLPELLARPENSNNSNNRNGYTGGRNGGGGGGGGGGRFGGRGRGSFRGGRGRRY